MKLKDLQAKLASEIEAETDEKLKQLGRDCEEKTNEAQQVKDDIKKARLLRKELEEKIEMQEEKRMLLSMQLNNLGKDI